MALMNGVLILGFGGHARSVADVALSLGVKQLRFIDSNARPNENFGGFPVLSEWMLELPDGWSVMPASGDNAARQAQIEEIIKRGWPLATLIAPTATIGFGSNVGPGTLIAHHAHVGPMAVVGSGCIINTGAIIEHECIVGDYTHVSVNATVAGRCRIGSRCFLGASSTVIDGVSVGDSVMLGAAACAHRDLVEPGTYIGVPARLLVRKDQG
ncbi:acetyltransferase [Pseudomonas izuensis]|uniref:Acetyltransferase n=1 Tax=Pseudomonas izuensis TaxID=2684212 RepID=A0ABM7RPJ2_9PSED|nr:acetyltransferase [Pseudomonas izuensis]BCX66891.1 acetyltransferase [Pseudomonas izuensis]